MPNLTLTSTLAADDLFRSRVTASIVQTALAQATVITLTGDAALDAPLLRKQGLVNAVLTEPWNQVTRFAWIVAADSNVLNAYSVDSAVEEIPDALIDAAVVVAYEALIL